MAGTKKNDDQIRKFQEVARELGCDESEERFDEALKRIAKTPAGKRSEDGKKS